MNIVILGAGAVGGYFGGKLAKNGYNVTFLVRRRRFEQLKNKGLKVNSLHGDFSIDPTLAIDINEIVRPDIVIVAIKNYQLSNAIPQISSLVEKGAKILPLMNGIEHLDLLVSKYGKANVLGGLCQVESTLDLEGNVIQTSQMQDIIFGSLTNEKSESLSVLKEMLEKSGINVRLSDSILAEMWMKYIFITCLSGITSAIRQPIGVALQDSFCFSFLQDMIEEIYEITKAEQISLPNNTVQQILTKLQSLSPTMTSSMHRDLEKGLPLELESLHGTVLKMAAAHRIPTPNINAVYSFLHPFKDGDIG